MLPGYDDRVKYVKPTVMILTQGRSVLASFDHQGSVYILFPGPDMDAPPVANLRQGHYEHARSTGARQY